MTAWDIQLIGIGITLALQGYWDIRYQQIPAYVTLLSGGFGLLMSVYMGRAWVDILFGVLPGLVCLGIAKLTREAIGYGDGLLLCAMGLYIPYDEVLVIGMIACSLCGIWALMCFLSRRKSGKDTLPFVPFLLGAWIIYVFDQKGVLVL